MLPWKSILLIVLVMGAIVLLGTVIMTAIFRKKYEYTPEREEELEKLAQSDLSESRKEGMQ